MDQTDLNPIIDELSGNIADLDAALQPLLNTSLSSTASKLPLLDRAKLYALSTYAIESILFSSLRIQGVDAKAHPVFTELTRVRQYFEKIKQAESGPRKETQNLSLDKQAAGRFIKSALAGNDKYDAERAERQARAKEGALQKLEDLTRKMEASRSTKRKADKGSPSEDNESSEASSSGQKEEGDTAFTKAADASVEALPRKKHRKTATQMIDKQDKSGLSSAATSSPAVSVGDSGKKNRKKKKQRANKAASSSDLTTRQKSNKPPKSSKQAFEALLKGSSSNE